MAALDEAQRFLKKAAQDEMWSSDSWRILPRRMSNWVFTRSIRNVARKAGLSEAEADEVTQETLIAVAKKIGEFKHADNRGSFRAWLYQQARWRIADQFRARARAKPHREACPLNPSLSPGGGEG